MHVRQHKAEAGRSLPCVIDLVTCINLMRHSHVPQVMAELQAVDGELGAVRSSPHFGAVMADYELAEQLVSWVTAVMRVRGDMRLKHMLPCCIHFKHHEHAPVLAGAVRLDLFTRFLVCGPHVRHVFHSFSTCVAPCHVLHTAVCTQVPGPLDVAVGAHGQQ